MNEAITIRFSSDSDRDRLRELGELDGRRPPSGDVLLAESCGRLLAAVGVDGTVVADPFQRTAAVVRALQAQLDGDRAPRPPRRRRLVRRLLPG